jgi:hypothetical protein
MTSRSCTACAISSGWSQYLYTDKKT